MTPAVLDVAANTAGEPELTIASAGVITGLSKPFTVICAVALVAEATLQAVDTAAT
ncbi:hypothetical protein D3C85_1200890 [compost metagenome]